jgi:hypothetical protein
MTVMFAHPVAVHEGCDFETSEEVIDFALNVNMGLGLGGDAGLVHFSLFRLILL